MLLVKTVHDSVSLFVKNVKDFNSNLSIRLHLLSVDSLFFQLEMFIPSSMLEGN